MRSCGMLARLWGLACKLAAGVDAPTHAVPAVSYEPAVRCPTQLQPENYEPGERFAPRAKFITWPRSRGAGSGVVIVLGEQHEPIPLPHSRLEYLARNHFGSLSSPCHE